MKTISRDVLSYINADKPFVLATVIRTWGSAPRKAGSHMLLTAEKMTGSVSGGCVENNVFRQAQMMLGNRSNRLIHYGVSDAEAWQVGLSCGGEIDVLLESFNTKEPQDRKYWEDIHLAIEQDTGAVVVHDLNGNVESRNVMFPATWKDQNLGEHAQSCYQKRTSQLIESGDERYFLELIPPRHKLILIGAAHITTELVSLGIKFDFEVTVIDPRGFFTTHTMFADQPDVIHEAWPADILPQLPLTPYTYAVTLSHEPRIDDQALELLLRSQVAYVGALGSKKTHAKRIARLEVAGFSAAEIQRIHAPVGIDIHAQSAQEIALSILADLIREKNRYF